MRFGALAAALAAVAWLAAFPATVSAAAPRLIVVFGGTLDEPIVLDDWSENAAIVSALGKGTPVSRAALRNRPFLHVALFWGVTRVKAEDLASDEGLKALLAGPSIQRGRFYPAFEGKEPAIELRGTGPAQRSVPADALAMLRGHGIPVGRDTEDSPSAWRWPLVVLACVAGGVAVFAVARRRRGPGAAARLMPRR